MNANHQSIIDTLSAALEADSVADAAAEERLAESVAALAASNAQIVELNSQLGDLRAQAAIPDNRDSIIGGLNAQVQGLQLANDNLAGELVAARQALADLQSRIDAAQGQS